MSTKSEQVVGCFNEGFCCSQAVLSAYAEDFGLDRDTALKVSRCFGGGMGRMANTCGAVTGAFMVIGLKYANVDPRDRETKEKTYELVREFARRFRERNGSIVCRDLLGCDISQPAGLNAAREKGLFSSVCPRMLRDVTEILEEMIGE